MRRKARSILIAAAIITNFSLSQQSLCQSISLEDLQGFTLEDVKPSDRGKAFDKKHWAYKTLKNISEKYGLLVGEPGQSFNGNKALTRNEAAVILVNLVGKIEEQSMKLSEAEKARVEILQDELRGEIDVLSGRVAKVEDSVTELKGSISKLEESAKKSVKFTYGEDFRINGSLQTVFTANTAKGADAYASDNFSLPYSAFQISGKLHENLDYVTRIVPTRNFNDTSNRGLLEDVYVSTDILPNHTIYIGQTAVPVGMEAPLFPTDIDFVDYSQISRNLGAGYDVGVLVSGCYEFLDYFAGAYNGTGINATDTDREMNYVVQASVKPFARNSKLGDLKMGGSFLTGKNTVTTDTVGAHASYSLGNLTLKSEILATDGVLGTNVQSRGWFADAIYHLNDKFQILARYDQYDPNKKVSRDASTEYVGGVNYLWNDYLMLMFNVVHVDNKFGKDSQRMGLLSQLLF